VDRIIAVEKSFSVRSIGISFSSDAIC